MSTDLNTVLEALAAGDSRQMDSFTPQALLAQMAEENPTVALLAKYFNQRQEQVNTEAAEQENTELPEYSDQLQRAHADTVETAEALRELRERIEAVYAELETLRERNDSLAVALGACALCWGDDVSCPVCAGAGRAGFTPPDRELFAQYIAPALHHFLKPKGAQKSFSQDADARESLRF
jgi:DNA repair exonuclease SbcCD ATPase subunit